MLIINVLQQLTFSIFKIFLVFEKLKCMFMKKTIFSFAIIMFAMLGTCLSTAQENILTDERDGKQYKIIEIGNQVWIAENMLFESENSWLYNDKKRNGKKHGRLYTWSAALKACPSGWHLPSDKEWTELIDYVGDELSSGWNLRIEGTSGFNVRLSGFRDSTGLFHDMNDVAIFWTSTSIDKNNAWRCYFNRGYEDVVQDYYKKEGALSVRCIKN